MTDRDALYAAVLAEPDADAPRLVYADWLEEHPRGEADTARAHFIRLEIEAEGLPAGSPERAALESAAATLFNRHGEDWNAELPTWDEWYDSSLAYRRGFPDELRTVYRKLAYSGGRLFAVAPIRNLCVNTVSGRLTVYGGLVEPTGGRLPDLSGIRSLWVGPRLRIRNTADAARILFRTATQYPSLGNLRRLSFAGNDLDNDELLMLATALRDAVFRDSLEELDLSDNVIRSAAALSAAPGLDGLRRLVLTGNLLTSDGVRQLRNRFGDRLIV